MRLTKTISLLAVLLLGAPVANACHLAVSQMQFDHYHPNSASRIRGAITVNCESDSGNPLQVALSAGLHSGGNFHGRTLRHAAGHRVGYQIYTNPNYNQVWGDGSAGTAVRTVASAETSHLEVYGLVGSGQVIPTGSYSDQITVWVRY